MSWSTGRKPLPPDWERRRQRVFSRCGRRCELGWSMCTGRATEVDHIDDRDDHRLPNLRGVCHECHAERTKLQAAEGARAKWALTRPRARRHPGLL